MLLRALQLIWSRSEYGIVTQRRRATSGTIGWFGNGKMPPPIKVRPRVSKECPAREQREILPRIEARAHNQSEERSSAGGESWRIPPSPSWPGARKTKPRPNSEGQSRLHQSAESASAKFAPARA